MRQTIPTRNAHKSLYALHFDTPTQHVKLRYADADIKRFGNSLGLTWELPDMTVRAAFSTNAYSQVGQLVSWYALTK